MKIGFILFLIAASTVILGCRSAENPSVELKIVSGSEGLIRALSDPGIQKLAWELHGFRSGQSSATMDTKIMGNIAIPEQLDKVVPLPNYLTMNKILAAIKQ